MKNSNKNILNLQLVLLSFFVFITSLPGTKQDDDSSSPCSTPVTVADAKAKLQADGVAINKNYMAFSLAEAKLNFKNLITMQPMDFSSIIKQSVTPFGNVTITECPTQQTSNVCTRCVGYTELGPGIYPNTFNTIICDANGTISCGSQGERGECKNFGRDQDLLELDKSAKCDSSGKSPFKQEKKTYTLQLCCGCELF